MGAFFSKGGYICMPEVIKYKWCYWVKYQRNLSFKKNIRQGEKLTGNRFIGLAAEDTSYMVFERRWWEENI